MAPAGIPRWSSRVARMSIPERRLLRGLDLRQVEDDAGPGPLQVLVVVDDVEHGIDDRRPEPRPVRQADVPVVEVQPAGAEDPGREVELPPPVVDDRAPEEAPCPRVHLARHLLGHPQEERVPGDGELEVALVVEGHRGDLAERVLAIEHPAVRAGEQGVGHVADALLHRRFGFVAGPVPWIHCRWRSAGISLPANLPSRASCTVMPVPGIVLPGSRKAMRCPSRARAARRRMRADMSARLGSSRGARAARAARASGV